jgi:hypothetical protein
MIQNIILGISMLEPFYFILAACFIFITEGLIFYFFWRNWQLAFRVSVIANICSALMAIPLFFGGMFWVSPWVLIMNSGWLFITENELNILMDSILILPSLGLTLLIEWLIVQRVSSNERNWIPVVVANLITYSIIYDTLYIIGMWFGLTNTDPYVDVFDFFEGKLYHQVTDGTPAFDQITTLIWFAFLIGICLIFILAILYLQRRTSETSIIDKHD